MSVGKIQHESATLEKTTDPVFEETLHFLVRNPLTDTLLIKLMDRKTSFELGSMKQSLDLVFGRQGMIMEKQNFTLNTKSEAKVVLDMKLMVLKHGVSGIDEDDLDDEIKLPGDAPVPATTVEKSDPIITTKPVAAGDNDSPQLNRTPSVKQPSIVEELVTRSDESKPLLAAASVDEDKNMKIRLTIRYRYLTCHNFLW